MASNLGLAHSIPPLKTGAKACSRCGKDFHLFRSKKNCHNCGSMVCESCSSYRTKLPQFGYTQEVRCCSYCAHFLHVYKMDYARLSNLNIKTLRGYLLSYNIPTQGMIEKQDLIRAIQSLRPVPEEAEQFFRSHLPSTPDKPTTFYDELANLGRSNASTSSVGSSSSSGSSDGWTWDLDKFFSKLFSPDDPAASAPSQTRPNRSYSQSQSRPAASSTSNGAYSTSAPQRLPQQRTNPHQNHHQNQQNSYPSSRPAHPYPSSQSSPYRPTNTPSPQSRPAQPSAQTNRHPPPQMRPSQTQPSSSPAPAPAPSQPTLESIMTSNTDPSTLSIKVIKSLLDHSCVNYVGVIEKRDLVGRLQKLIENTKAENEMVQEQELESKKGRQSPKAGTAAEDENLCKICCDAALNCVMLNCNHMSTCMDCGKLIMEGSRMCPICREYVVKLLHVFRA